MFGNTPKDVLIIMAAATWLIASRIAAKPKYGHYFKELSMESVLGRPINWKEYHGSKEKFYELAKEYAAKFGAVLDIDEIKK